MKEDIEKIEFFKFYETIYKLKKLVRKGWEIRGITNPESVAEHTFGVTLLSLVFAKTMNLDVVKCLIIALIHDIGEAIIGDITPRDKISSNTKYKLENDAVSTIVSYIDDSDYLKKMWEDYEFELSDEGRLVKEIDKLEMAFQAYSYEKEQGKNLNEFYDYVMERINSKEINLVFSKLLKKRQSN